jgi:hypothetical protein
MLARVIAYCLVGIPSSVQALLWADVFPALLPYLLGLIALESVLVIRLIYRAGVEAGLIEGQQEILAGLKREKARRRRASSVLASSVETEVRSTYPASSHSAQ